MNDRLVVSLCFGLGLFFLCSCGQTKSAVSARITAVSESGAFIVKQGEGEVAAMPGQILHDGDVVHTGPEGWANLVVLDAGVVKVRQDSMLSLSRTRIGKDGHQNRLLLSSGRLFCYLRKLAKSDTFEVQTPTAVVGVRGTSFSVDCRKDVLVQVLTGVVRVSDPEGENGVDVAAFEKGVIPAGEVPLIKVSSFSEADFQEMSGQAADVSSEVFTEAAAVIEEVSASKEAWESLQVEAAKSAAPKKS